MEKTCDCECHKLHPIPCMHCDSRHEQSAELAPSDDDDHDGKTEPAASFPGFPF